MSKRRYKSDTVSQKLAKSSRYHRYDVTAPSWYHRATAQAIGRRDFVKGRDRTGGYYGRFRGEAGEHKFKDKDVDDVVVAAGLVISELTVIPQGDSESERIGRRITIKSVHAKGTIRIFSATSAAATNDTVHCMLVLDTQTNGAVFAATDLYETDAFKSFRNLANSSRFRVLYTHTFVMKVPGAAPSGAAYIYGSDVKYININKKCNIKIEYDNSLATGVVSTVRSNNLYWVTMGAEGNAEIKANFRVRYSDY